MAYKRKYFFGTRAAGATFATGQAGATASKCIQSAVQTIAGGCIVRCSVGTRNSSGVLDIDIYDSEDNLTFAKVASFTQIAAGDADYFKDPGRRLGPFARVYLTLTSGTGFSTTRVWIEYVEDRSSGRHAGGLTET